jgi:hypothetical protein
MPQPIAFNAAIDCCARTKSKVTAVSVISKSIRCGGSPLFSMMVISGRMP